MHTRERRWDLCLVGPSIVFVGAVCASWSCRASDVVNWVKDSCYGNRRGFCGV